MPTVREAAFRVFEHFGVDRLFGNPGSTELPMLKALPEGFRYVLGLNEAVVVGDGRRLRARRAGKPALVNLHSSAGTGHSLGNLFTAYKNNTPLVVTAGQQARSDPAARSVPLRRAPDRIPAAVRQVGDRAGPRRGRAAGADPRLRHRADPADGAGVRVDPGRRLGPRVRVARAARADAVHRRRARPGSSGSAPMLDGAERPALVIGTGVANCGGWEAAIRLAERTGCAVWAAPYAARETFPEDHPQFAGFLPAWRDKIQALLDPYDAILVAGAPVFTYHVEGSGPHWPPHAKLMALSDDPQHLAALPGGGGVLGDVADGLAQLAERANARTFAGTSHQLDRSRAGA